MSGPGGRYHRLDYGNTSAAEPLISPWPCGHSRGDIDRPTSREPDHVGHSLVRGDARTDRKRQAARAKRHISPTDGSRRQPAQGSVRIQFTIKRPYYITAIHNYHWNNGTGAAQGYIGLRGEDGTDYGPWDTIKNDPQYGPPNTGWTVRPNILLPSGTYTVIDSHPASWSFNTRSQRMGFSKVLGHPAD
jgi:hypothetical protein